MAVADVVHVVAVKIHVAPAGRILDEDALGLGDRIEARRRHRLAQEIALVLGQQRARGGIERAPLPRARARPVRLVSLSDWGTDLSAEWFVVRISLSYRGLSPVSSHQRALEPAATVDLGNKCRDDIYRLRQACSLPNTSRSSTRCSDLHRQRRQHDQRRHGRRGGRGAGLVHVHHRDRGQLVGGAVEERSRPTPWSAH